MGQAKQRQKSDSLYGKVPQESRERGLVISIPMRIEENSILIKNGMIDPQELRFSLLFWDKLFWPQNNIFAVGENPDINFLEQENVLSKSVVQVGSGDVATMVAQAQLMAFQNLDEKEPGKWALAQGENSFNLVTTKSVQSAGASIELHKAIPIPDHDVPLAEILEFKLKRRDELLLLRAHLDSLALEVAQSNDPGGSIRSKVKEIDEACSNLILVGKEWQFPMKLSSMKASLNIDPTKLVVGTMAAYGGATYLGLPMAATVAALAVAGSLINIKADIGFRPLKRPANPYRYVYEIERNLT